MSNIFTNFPRVVPHPGKTITPGEAEWIVDRMLNDRGSYNVPVAARRPADGALLDIQAGSRRNADSYNFWDDHPVRHVPDSQGQPQVERVELRWRGRLVRRAQMEPTDLYEQYRWEQRSADDWDNCLNAEYLADTRASHHALG